MTVTYTDKAKQWGEGYALLQEATDRLEEVLGESAGLVSAEWDRTQDARGRVLYRLRLSDFTGQVSATFTHEELQSPGHMRFRLLGLWGDLLQMRSDEQVKKLQQLVGEGE
ncbi:MAG TPA: hypothetical protein VJ739_06310 [Gemmataceae bacterium]|nr:hypothetical protein [Gemmataceae bacterium]